MALANANDANVFLDSTTLSVTDGDDTEEQRRAEDIIRAYLYGRISPTTMDGWSTTLNSVPPLIRGIAGRLVAAFRYGAKYSESNNEVSPYAQMLHNQAMSMLDGILTGRLVIPELVLVGTEIADNIHITDDYFYPNDSTADTPDDVIFKRADRY